MKRGTGWLDGIIEDIVFAVRLSRRQPGVVLVTVGGLAVAIGFSTLVFSFLGAEWLRPLAVRDPASLFALHTAPNRVISAWPHADFLRLRDTSRLLRFIATAGTQAALDTTGSSGAGESVEVRFVSEGFFETMGGHAVSGRLFGSDDYAADAVPTVVINHTYWTHRLRADASIIGNVVSLGGEAFTVVGVADPAFGGPTPYPPAFWAPLAVYTRTLGPRRAGPASGDDFPVRLFGRLDAESTIEQAQAELDALASEVLARRADGDEPFRPTLAPADFRAYGSGAAEVTLALSFLLGVIALLLLVAGANVASLLLASAIARQREVGIRLALGASRMRVVRQLVTESLLLGMLGGAAGLLLATWALSVLHARLPAMTVDRLPDWRVYGFVAVVSILTGLFAGLAPARYGARGDIVSPLAGGAIPLGGSLRPRWARSLLVGAQAAVTALMLVVTGLLTVAAVHIVRFDYGIDVDRLVTVAAPLQTEDYDADRARVYWSDAREAVRRVPGVDGSSLVFIAPFEMGGYVHAVVRQGGRQSSVYLNYTAT